MMQPLADQPVFTPIEVAELFRTSVRTVAYWERNGRLGCFRTPGGHRRYPREAVAALACEKYGGPWTP